MNKLNKNTKILLFCALAVLVNVVFGDFVSMLKIPLLFMDTIGTIFIAACYGMGYGVLTGVATNLLMGFTASPSAIPFALVNVVVAVVVALISKAGKKGFSLPKAILAGLLLAILCPMVGAPIRIFLFGGLTGSGTDLVIMALKQSGQELFTSVYLGAVSGNLVDKLLSCVLVSLLLQRQAMKRSLSLA